MRTRGEREDGKERRVREGLKLGKDIGWLKRVANLINRGRMESKQKKDNEVVGKERMRTY